MNANVPDDGTRPMPMRFVILRSGATRNLSFQATRRVHNGEILRRSAPENDSCDG